MLGSMIEFPAPRLKGAAGAANTARGYLSMPPSGQGPGLLVLQEWWGLVDHIKDVADRFAQQGYVVLAPDLYRGESSVHPSEAQRLLMALDMADTASMLRGAAEYLLNADAVVPKRVGALGFCMGGQLALYAATAHPDVIHAVVDFYGVFNPKVPVDITALRAPVLGHFGEHDATIPLSRVDTLFADIARAGAHGTQYRYRAGHAFFNDTRPAAYDAAAATLAWERTLTFLSETLQPE